MHLDPKRLLIFRTVAREGSVSAAARALGWTQPAVSQHLRALENEIGLPVMLRGASGITLNEAGERLLRYADTVAGALQAAETDLEELASGGGTVRVAAFPSAMADLVPAAMATVAETAPGIRIRVTELEPPEAIAATLTNDADIAVVFEYDDSADDVALAERALGYDGNFVVVPAGHERAGDGVADLGSFADDAWVSGCVRCSAHLQKLAKQSGFSPNVVHETDDFHAAQSLVARTGSVTLLPGMAMRAYQRPDVAVGGVKGDRGRKLVLRYRPGAELVPAIAKVLEALETAIVATLPGDTSGL